MCIISVFVTEECCWNPLASLLVTFPAFQKSSLVFTYLTLIGVQLGIGEEEILPHRQVLAGAADNEVLIFMPCFRATCLPLLSSFQEVMNLVFYSNIWKPVVCWERHTYIKHCILNVLKQSN